MDLSHHGTPGVGPIECDPGIGHLALADNAPVMIWRRDAAMNGTWFNRHWLDFTGRTLQQELGQGWIETVHPEDHERYSTTFLRAFAARQPFTLDYRLRRRDGQYRWIRDNSAPFTDAAGTFAGYLGSGIDVHDHVEARDQLKDALRRQDIVVDELNHRTKNIAAAIQSIASQTLRRANVDRDIVDKLESRLISLAHAHSLLAGGELDGVNLKTLMTRILRLYDRDAGGAPRITVSGGDVSLPSNWVVLIGLTVHELATNASKYGALSGESGQVLFGWRPVEDDRGGRLAFEWREEGGPPVRAPEHKGFGMSLMERGIGVELGGDVNLEFRPQGVIWKAEIPLEEQAGDAA
jgi:PAS domain S-box-containing protein